MADRVLITGGNGFIGRHVQNVLKHQGIPFDTLDQTGHPTYKVDICGSLDWIAPRYSRVIHLAGVLGTHELFDQARRAIDVNIHGTLSVLELCRQQGIPFTGITMDHVWTNVYETTKLAAERLAQAWSREYGIETSYVTVYNAYGEYQAHGPGHPQKIIPAFARAAWEKRPIPIWGDGSQIVDLVYAGDVAELLVSNPLRREGGYGHPRTVLEVAQMVWNVACGDRPMLVEFHPMRRGEHKSLRDPVATNPTNMANFEDTFIETVQWYRDKETYPEVGFQPAA